MPGRKFDAGSQYRYGFNGKENDPEPFETSTYDYGFRIYSPGVARFLSVDPLTQSYPYYTPYQFAGNSPIMAVDLDGLEEQEAITITEEKLGETKLKVAWKKGNGKLVHLVNRQAMSRTAVVKAVTTGVLGWIGRIFTSGRATPQDVATDLYPEIGGTSNEYLFWRGWTGPGRGFDLPPASPEELPQWLSDYWPEGAPIYLPIQTEPVPSPVPAPEKAPDDGDNTNRKPRNFWVTYTKTKINPDGTSTVYSGRTSGTYTGGAPTTAEAEKAILGREANHTILNNEGYGVARLDKYSANQPAIRGREQHLVDNHGGAQSEGGLQEIKFAPFPEVTSVARCTTRLHAPNLGQFLTIMQEIPRQDNDKL